MKRNKKRTSGIRPDIVRAAAQVFGRGGYERATLDEIASIVGIQKGSLYHHIDSKEQLLFAIHVQLYEELDRRMDAVVIDATEPAIEKIEGVVSAIIETIAKHREMVNVFLRDYRALEPNHLEDLVQHRRHLLKRIEIIIRQIFADERRNDLDIRYTIYAVLGMCYWVNEWLDGHDVTSAGHGSTRDDHAKIAATFSDILVNGLRTRGSTVTANAAKTLVVKTSKRASKKK
jgi:AcrR family transcriptional regulator